MAEVHEHDRVVHSHAHFHVTHYLRHGEEWAHLTCQHDHDHDHAATTHCHDAHENAKQEHLREAHIHDHAHPVG